VDDLERLLDAPLHVFYLKQLNLIKAKYLNKFKNDLLPSVSKGQGTGSSSDDLSVGTEYEAMAKADELFRSEAESLTRTNPEWSYSKEASIFKQSLQEILNKMKIIANIKAKSAKQNQQTMQYLQVQHQQLQSMQQQIMVREQ
jgi:uncharacterized membrane protein YgaE (UPF0421/DUF939 family)